jgi:hypothetical protein
MQSVHCSKKGVDGVQTSFHFLQSEVTVVIISMNGMTCWLLPKRIGVRIGPPYPPVCRRRRLNEDPG